MLLVDPWVATTSTHRMGAPGSQEDFQIEDEAGPTDHNLGNQEWRQLLAEAEALLVPLPEQNWGEETQRLRTTSLGDGQKTYGPQR